MYSGARSNTPAPSDTSRAVSQSRGGSRAPSNAYRHNSESFDSLDASSPSSPGFVSQKSHSRIPSSVSTDLKQKVNELEDKVADDVNIIGLLQRQLQEMNVSRNTGSLLTSRPRLENERERVQLMEDLQWEVEELSTKLREAQEIFGRQHQADADNVAVLKDNIIELEMEIDVLDEKKQEVSQRLDMVQSAKATLTSRNLELEDELRFLRQDRPEKKRSFLGQGEEEFNQLRREMKMKEFALLDEVALYKTRSDLSDKKVEDLTGDVAALREALDEYSTSFKQVSEELWAMQQQLTSRASRDDMTKASTSLFDELSNAFADNLTKQPSIGGSLGGGPLADLHYSWTSVGGPTTSRGPSLLIPEDGDLRSKSPLGGSFCENLTPVRTQRNVSVEMQKTDDCLMRLKESEKKLNNALVALNCQNKRKFRSRPSYTELPCQTQTISIPSVVEIDRRATICPSTETPFKAMSPNRLSLVNLTDHIRTRMSSAHAQEDVLSIEGNGELEHYQSEVERLREALSQVVQQRSADMRRQDKTIGTLRRELAKKRVEQRKSTKKDKDDDSPKRKEKDDDSPKKKEKADDDHHKKKDKAKVKKATSKELPATVELELARQAEKIAALENEKAKHKERLKEMVEMVKALESERARLHERVAQQHLADEGASLEALAKIKTENKRVLLAVDDVTKEKQRMVLEIDEIKTENKRVLLAVDDMTKEQEERHLLIDKMTKEQEERRLLIDKMTQEHNHHLQLIEELKNENSSHLDSISQITRENEEKLDTIDQMTQEHNDQLTIINELQRVNSVHLIAITKLEKSTKYLKLQNEELTAALQKMQDDPRRVATETAVPPCQEPVGSPRKVSKRSAGSQTDVSLSREVAALRKNNQSLKERLQHMSTMALEQIEGLLEELKTMDELSAAFWEAPLRLGENLKKAILRIKATSDSSKIHIDELQKVVDSLIEEDKARLAKLFESNRQKKTCPELSPSNASNTNGALAEYRTVFRENWLWKEKEKAVEFLWAEAQVEQLEYTPLLPESRCTPVASRQFQSPQNLSSGGATYTPIPYTYPSSPQTGPINAPIPYTYPSSPQTGPINAATPLSVSATSLFAVQGTSPTRVNATLLRPAMPCDSNLKKSAHSPASTISPTSIGESTPDWWLGKGSPLPYQPVQFPAVN